MITDADTYRRRHTHNRERMVSAFMLSHRQSLLTDVAADLCLVLRFQSLYYLDYLDDTCSFERS